MKEGDFMQETPPVNIVVFHSLLHNESKPVIVEFCLL